MFSLERHIHVLPFAVTAARSTVGVVQPNPTVPAVPVLCWAGAALVARGEETPGAARDSDTQSYGNSRSFGIGACPRYRACNLTTCYHP
eukprot:4027700-Pleurochrysis_carterae.AAC.6